MAPGGMVSGQPHKRRIQRPDTGLEVFIGWLGSVLCDVTGTQDQIRRAVMHPDQLKHLFKTVLGVHFQQRTRLLTVQMSVCSLNDSDRTVLIFCHLLYHRLTQE